MNIDMKLLNLAETHRKMARKATPGARRVAAMIRGKAFKLVMSAYAVRENQEAVWIEWQNLSAASPLRSGKND